MRRLDSQALTGHLDRLYRAAWALCGSREDAEDLVQETCLRVLARPRILRGDDELAYLMRVLRNTFLTGRRTASRRPQVAATPVEEFEVADPGAASNADAALEAGEVFSAMAALPEPFRLALVAVDVVGLSYREAAEVLGTHEATITTRLYRARQQVARALTAAGVGPASEAQAAGSPEQAPQPGPPPAQPRAEAGYPPTDPGSKREGPGFQRSLA